MIFQFLSIFWHLGSCWSPRRHQHAFKTPSRASKTPPRASKMPPRHSCGRPKNIDFPCVFQGFRCPGPAWSYLDPTWPPIRLQEPLERVPRLPRRLQESLRRLQRPPRHPQEPPRCSQDTSREVQKSNISSCCSICSLSYAFLGDLRSTWPSKRLQDAPKSLQSVPKTVQAASKIRLQEPSVEAEAIYQGWSGGGSPA